MIHHELHTDIEIDAAPRRVWAVLTDFAAYPEWNPPIRIVRGIPRVGERLEIGIQPTGARGMTFRPRVLVAEAGREQSEEFSGILVPLFRANLERDTRRGFEEMNLALKQRAETGVANTGQ